MFGNWKEEAISNISDWEIEYKGFKIICKYGDITKEPVDAIVNAANEYLCHGGGVAGAISRRGGSVIDDESADWVRDNGTVNTGETAYTNKGNLGCKKYCIHAVGPVWSRKHPEKCEELLSLAVYNSYLRAEELECVDVAIPAISSGIFGFPTDRCAKIFADTTRKFVDDMEKPKTLKTLVMCNIESATVKHIRDAFKNCFKDITDNIPEESKEESDEADIKENSEVQSKLSDLDIQNQDTKVVVENSEKVEEADSSDLKEDDNNASQ